jgi:hypothetical protein
MRAFRLGVFVPIPYPSHSSGSDRNQPVRIGVCEPPGSPSSQGNPRVSETTGEDPKGTQSSKGSRVRITSARPGRGPESRGSRGFWASCIGHANGPYTKGLEAPFCWMSQGTGNEAPPERAGARDQQIGSLPDLREPRRGRRRVPGPTPGRQHVPVRVPGRDILQSEGRPAGDLPGGGRRGRRRRGWAPGGARVRRRGHRIATVLDHLFCARSKRVAWAGCSW